jgi:phosphorylcholine metabolism protein LicD
VLKEPYSWEKGRLIVQEMTELLTLDLVRQGLVTKKVELSIGYDRESLQVLIPGKGLADTVYAVKTTGRRYAGKVGLDYYGRPSPQHAHGTGNLDRWTNSTRRIRKAILEIFDRTLGDKYEITSPASKYPLESMITAVYRKGTVKASLQTMDTDLPQGVHIDIFSIESVPVNPVARRVKGTLAMGAQYIAVSTLFRKLTNEKKKEFFGQTTAGRINYALRMTVGTLFSFLPAEAWAWLFERAVSCRKDTGLWAVPTDIKHYFGHIMPKDVYYPPIKGTFEDFEINLPHDPDAYLENQYGDYMTIPPEAQREKHWSIGFDLNAGAQETEHD